MADVFDKETKRLLRSVNTPDFQTDQYIINPDFVPDCESKYIVVELDNTIREMTTDEKEVVDYVAPPPKPTSEQVEETRKSNIRAEIAKTYSPSDETQIVRIALVQLLPDDIDVQEWNSVVEAAILMYPKQIRILQPEDDEVVGLANALNEAESKYTA